MGNRVTDAEVKAIMSGTFTFSTTPFIDMAHILVEKKLVPIGTLEEDQLTVIEKLLAAHFSCLKQNEKASQSMGGASESYLKQGGLRLEATTYGQQALVMDTTGTLVTLGKKGVVFETLHDEDEWDLCDQ
jgi:hypothetical protein